VRFVVPSTGTVQDWVFQRDRRRFTLSVSGNLILDHAESLVEAAFAGTAIIQISSYVTTGAIRGGRSRPSSRSFRWRAPRCGSCTRRTRHLTPRVRAFVDFMVELAEAGTFTQPVRSARV
jgi:LysR family transcriptional regulator for bpeEF and oprC